MQNLLVRVIGALVNPYTKERGFNYELTHAQKLQLETLEAARKELASHYLEAKTLETAGQKTKITLPVEVTARAANSNTFSSENIAIQGRLVDRTIENVKHFLTPATVEEYADFLEAHFARGGRHSHFYDYPFSRANILVARRDMLLPRGFGASSLNVLVPAGINVTEPEGEDSHNNLYFVGQPLQDQKDRHFGLWIPLYPDVARILISRNVHFDNSSVPEIEENRRPKGLLKAAKLDDLEGGQK